MLKRVFTLRWWGDSYEHQVGAALVLYAFLFGACVIGIGLAAVLAAH